MWFSLPSSISQYHSSLYRTLAPSQYLLQPMFHSVDYILRRYNPYSSSKSHQPSEKLPAYSHFLANTKMLPIRFLNDHICPEAVKNGSN